MLTLVINPELLVDSESVAKSEKYFNSDIELLHLLDRDWYQSGYGSGIFYFKKKLKNDVELAVSKLRSKTRGNRNLQFIVSLTDNYHFVPKTIETISQFEAFLEEIETNRVF